MERDGKELKELGLRNRGRLVVDSRLVEPGDVFVATCCEGSDFYRGVKDKEYKGPYRFDSHCFVEDAIKNGASTVVVSKPEFISNLNDEVEFVVVKDGIGYLGELMRNEVENSGKKVVGVTGSTGKSSAVEMVKTVLGKGTYKHLSSRPTPISIPLRALNSEDFWTADRLVIEMPMDGLGQIRQLCEITPVDVGLMLNINDSHINQLGSVKNILKAKMELVENVIANDGMLVINTDDDLLRREVKKLKDEGVPLLSYGYDKEADLQIVSFSLKDDESELVVKYKDEFLKTKTSFLGKGIEYSLTGALGVGLMMGVEKKVVLKRLTEVRPLPGRISLLRGKRGELIVDDTRLATPQSSIKLLEMVEMVKDRRKVLIQGPIKRSYQHGEVDNNFMRLTKQFDKVIFYEDIDWASGLEGLVLKNETQLLDWYVKNIGIDDLVVINASEGVRMWEVVRRLVMDEREGQVYNPDIHD